MTPIEFAPAPEPLPTILVVDDDAVFRSLTRAALIDNGLVVIEAADGIEAIDWCNKAEPSLLLVDAVMPNMDGFALCRELRSRAATRHTPIVIVTGLQDQSALDQAYEAGATDFIVKPIEWGTLAQRVRYVLRNAGEFAALRDKLPDEFRPATAPENAALETSPRGAVQHDAPAAHRAREAAPNNAVKPVSILIVDDDPVIRSLTRDALENDGHEVFEAEDGLAAYAACQHAVPGMIISDVVMPGVDGFDLCRLLRGQPETALVPILMATGLDDDGAVAAAFDAGATDFIAKPFNWHILRYRVRYMIRAARAFTDLIATKERAEAADRAKSAFLANVSHELRTPLNAVIGFSEIMHQQVLGPLSTQYAEYAKIISDSGSHLLTIINDLLDVAKAEAQGQRVGNEEVHIPDIASFSVSMVEAMARRADITCSVDVEAPLPALRGDAKKLRQVLINLLANAIKFTPAGGSVVLRARRDPAGGLRLEVQDTGIGIPADKIEIALTPFGQIDSRLPRENDGVGLGLPLTKRLVELHDGTLEIASELGLGTTITIRFPRERVLMEQTAAA
jgi:two-component system, cell cycle sensor histidine kinase PleC